MRHSQRSSRLGALIVCVSLMAGCSTPSMTQVKQFGDASNTLSASSINALNYVNEVEVERKIYSVASNPKTGPVDATFESFFDRNVDANRQKALDVRLQALNGLSTYARSLGILATTDYATEIDTASKELNGALISLGNSYQSATNTKLGLTEKDFGLISTAVDAIGNGVVESKRREAIKTIVKTADPAVQKVARLISQELSEDSDLAKYAITAIGQQRSAMQTAYNSERQLQTSTFDTRLTQLQKIRVVYNAQSESKSLFRNVSQGAKAMADAHEALVNAVNADKFESAELARALAELQAYAKSVQAFRAGLTASN